MIHDLRRIDAFTLTLKGGVVNLFGVFYTEHIFLRTFSHFLAFMLYFFYQVCYTKLYMLICRKGEKGL